MAIGIPGLVEVGEWLEDDSLLLLEGWARDGVTLPEIADKIGISRKTLGEWRKKYPEISNALKGGTEMVNYKVENALLKSALGYRTKESKIITVMRFGKVIETRKEVTEKEIAPNPASAQFWLTNKLPKKWSKDPGTAFDIDDEESNIRITVTRASKHDKIITQQVNDEVYEDDLEEWDEYDEDNESSEEEWEDVINESVEITSMTADEKHQAKIKAEEARNKNNYRAGA